MTIVVTMMGAGWVGARLLHSFPFRRTKRTWSCGSKWEPETRAFTANRRVLWWPGPEFARSSPWLGFSFFGVTLGAPSLALPRWSAVINRPILRERDNHHRATTPCHGQHQPS